METCLLAQMRQVLVQGQLSPDLCAATFEELGRVDLRSPVQRLLRAERIEGLQVFDFFDSDRIGAVVWALKDSSVTKRERREALQYMLPPGAIYRQRARVRYLALMGRLIAVSPHPCREVRRSLRGLRREMLDLPWPYSTFACVSCPATPLIERDVLQRRINGVRVALALEAYHAKFGRYPDSLAALRTYPRWKLPEDPLTGRDFQYRRKGNGFVLYSPVKDYTYVGGFPMWPSMLSDSPDHSTVWKFAK